MITVTLVITAMRPQNPWLADVRDQLQRTTPDVASRKWSSAASVLAVAKAIVAEAQADVAAEREAKVVAATAATTEQSVEAAAVMTAQAASHARDRKADATAPAAHELAETAAQTATGIQSRADEFALQVATAAVQAVETVSASIASGGDADSRPAVDLPPAGRHVGPATSRTRTQRYRRAHDPEARLKQLLQASRLTTEGSRKDAAFRRHMLVWCGSAPLMGAEGAVVSG